MSIVSSLIERDSPSSGLFRVKVYNARACGPGAGEHGMAVRTGSGLFSRAVRDRFPLLPLEEEGRLNDLPLREDFIERIFHSPDRRTVRTGLNRTFPRADRVPHVILV